MSYSGSNRKRVPNSDSVGPVYLQSALFNEATLLEGEGLRVPNSLPKPHPLFIIFTLKSEAILVIA